MTLMKVKSRFTLLNEKDEEYRWKRLRSGTEGTNVDKATHTMLFSFGVEIWFRRSGGFSNDL
jgi:hypothetical protein